MGIRNIDISRAYNSQARVSTQYYSRSGIRNIDISIANNPQASVGTQYYS